MFELFEPKADVRIDMGTNLPHWFQPGVSYFVTFRTDDSIPVDVRRRWHARRTAWLSTHGITHTNPNWKSEVSALPEGLGGNTMTSSHVNTWNRSIKDLVHAFFGNRNSA